MPDWLAKRHDLQAFHSRWDQARTSVEAVSPAQWWGLARKCLTARKIAWGHDSQWWMARLSGR